MTVSIANNIYVVTTHGHEYMNIHFLCVEKKNWANTCMVNAVHV